MRHQTLHHFDGDQSSDKGKAMNDLVNEIDRPAMAAEKKRRFDYVASRLTHAQHELFTLMACGFSRAQIMQELHLSKQDLSKREKCLMKKIKKVLEKGFTHPPFRHT